jgi:sugar lactone lactonase YvrE
MSRYLAVATILLGIFAQSSPTAVEQLAALLRQAHTAKVAGDKHAYLQAARDAQDLLNDAPDSVEAVARAYAAADDLPNSLAALMQYAELGQADDTLLNGNDQSFSALHSLPEYKSILEHFAENKTAISRAETAFSLSDPGILAEDITYDAQSKSFLITSVLEKKIIRVAFDGKASAFAQSPSHWPMLAVKADSARNRVWATEVAVDGFTGVPKQDWRRSAVLCFDLKTGALLRRIEAPVPSALGDMVLTTDGDPIVTDGNSGAIYRIADGKFKEINRKDFISPQTPSILPDSDRVFVPDYARGVGILDLQNGHVEWLNRGQDKKFAINGIDGLYYDRGSLILTQNGTSPERVIRLQLDKALTRIVSEQIIERATPTLGDPTHGVIVGDSFFYIANSGWNQLDDHGDVKTGSKLSPARVMRFQLR